jgi:hypothetical protein
MWMRGALALAIVGCGGVAITQPPKTTADATPIETTPFGVPGESMVYRVALRGLTVGRVEVAVGREGLVDGHRAIIVKSHGHSDGLVAMVTDLVWDLTTTLDLDHTAPIDEIEESWSTFDGHQQHDRRERTWSDGDHRHNLHSAIGALRAWHSEREQHRQVDMKIDQLRFGVDIWEASHEFLDAFAKPSVRYDGIADSRFAFSIWLSDDASRVPLRARADTEWGRITVELVEYEAPKD